MRSSGYTYKPGYLEEERIEPLGPVNEVRDLFD